MAKTALKKGQILHKSDSIVRTVEIVLSGSVEIYDDHHSLIIPAGGIIGFLETPASTYTYTSRAAEDAVVFDYPYNAHGDLEKIISSNPRIIPNMVTAALRVYDNAYKAYQDFRKDADSLYTFVHELYDTYRRLCGEFKVQPQILPGLEEINRYIPEEDVPSWEVRYYEAMRTLPAEVKKAFYDASVYTGTGIILECERSVGRILECTEGFAEYMSALSSCAISGEEGDFFDLYSDLLFVAKKNPYADTSEIENAVSRLIVTMSNLKYADMAVLHARVKSYRKTLADIEAAVADARELNVEQDAYEALGRSLDTILVYAGIAPEGMEEFRTLLDHYRLLPDKNAIDDVARTLRKNISKWFYHIYYSAFLKSLSDKRPPAALRMFFAFGYMDEELCGMNNAALLFDLINSMEKDPEERVITFYDWLLKIYKGEEEPSRNEFDMDYAAYLRDQKNGGYITEAEEKKRLNDRGEKVRFEIENFFTLTNRMTFGRVTSFCPVLSEHNVLRPLKSIFVDYKRINECFDEIRKTDYTCFYRQVIYTKPEIGIAKEYINKEVLPYVILMPNIGSRACLWQDTSGIKRDTPGRIALSILPIEDVMELMRRIAAEFKWELCKHIQGVRWNDVTDPSLTADYCDYLQFFKKNRDLSNDAKEKLKLQLARAKNSYREAFVMDYVQWVKYESTGSPRLNKVAREILFKYAPFSAKTLSSLSANPIYRDMIEKREIKRQQRLHILGNLCKKLTNQGTEIPEEIQKEIEFQKK